MDAPKPDDQQNKKEKYIGFYVVAFLDLLGQQDTLRKLTALPNIENQEEVAVFKQKVGDLYRPLYALQTFFKSSIKPFLDGGIDETALLPSEQELLRKFRSTPVFYRHFSDSLIVHIPLREDIAKFQCRAIYSLFAATASTFFSCMACSCSIRGGIELGLAMEIEEGEIYGPALARAYELESRVAKYPRIVIGKEIIRFVEMIARSEPNTVEENANKTLATKSLGLLAVDDDGNTFLDWLGSDFRTAVPLAPENALKVYNFIIQESIKHKETQNSKLGFRYSLLRSYAESRLPDWGVTIEADRSN